MSDTTVLAGFFIVAIGGLVMGASPTPLKFMRMSVLAFGNSLAQA